MADGAQARELWNYDHVAAVYDRTRGFPEGVGQQIGAGLAKLLRQSKRPLLLEVGVGTGRVAIPLAEQGIRVVGLDLSRKMLEQLQAKSVQVDVLMAEATCPPFRSGRFDAVLFVHVLHLLPDPPAAIHTALELIRTGGLVIAGVTHHAPSITGEAGETIRRITDEVAGEQPIVGATYGLGGKRATFAQASEVFRELLAAKGIAVTEVELARWRETRTARDLLSDLADRVHTQTWAIPDERLGLVVERAAERLEQLCDGLDTIHESEGTFSALVGRIPG
jgi:ubiquinone/menaquinone biosynthesis C-methylase UbiE